MPTALETAIESLERGLSEPQIVSKMKESGFDAREINEAINEAKIKRSITEKPISGNGMEDEAMEPSIMEKQVEEIEVPQPLPVQQTNYGKKQRQQSSMEQEAPYQYPQYQEQPYSPGYQQATQQPYYTDQQQQPQQQAIDIELVEEIAEEAANEKFNDFKNKIGDIVGFKQLTEKRIDDLDERLKRIETNLDKIQMSLLGKMKEYGENIKTLGGEMQNVEDSFSKILSPLISNVKELNALTERIKDRTVNKRKK